jgi:hypothetical protein
LHGDLQNPAEPLKEATKISPALSKWSRMATDGW